MALVTAAAIVVALKAAHDTISKAGESEDSTTLKAAIRDVAQRLSGVLSDALSLQDQVVYLSRQADNAARQEVWRFCSADEKMRYLRMESLGGAFVYISREFADDPAASPQYCAGCFEGGTRAKLQPTGADGFAICLACGATPRTGC